MLEIKEIRIEEFEEKIYSKYVLLFPPEEQRDWDKITKAYNNGIEKFYAILDDDKNIGFFILEKVKDYPYYLDYFAIYDEYQSKGYGSKSIKKLLDDIIKEDGLLGEIEKVTESDPITIRRWKFYEKLGFKKTDYEFLFYKVLFNLIIYPENFRIDMEELGDVLMDYYRINLGEEEARKHCKVFK